MLKNNWNQGVVRSKTASSLAGRCSGAATIAGVSGQCVLTIAPSGQVSGTVTSPNAAAFPIKGYVDANVRLWLAAMQYSKAYAITVNPVSVFQGLLASPLVNSNQTLFD